MAKVCEADWKLGHVPTVFTAPESETQPAPLMLEFDSKRTILVIRKKAKKQLPLRLSK